jgi:hypothetical protein
MSECFFHHLLTFSQYRILDSIQWQEQTPATLYLSHISVCSYQRNNTEMQKLPSVSDKIQY